MSASKADIGSDLAKVDAYQLTAEDYDEIPEATEADFARASVNKGGVPARGRPSLGDKAKKQVTLRLDRAVIAKFRATGEGWQARMNAWLAAQSEVAGMIASFEDSASKMRRLLDQLSDPNIDLRVSRPERMQAIESIEKQIAATENAAASVRKALPDKALLASPK